MDPFTHGLVGAAAGGLVATRQQVKYGMGAGFIAATLADLDVLLTRSSDPLFQLELHRQFSHALLFIPLGGLIALGLLWWRLRGHLSLARAYAVCCAGYATAGPLDACTSYGTQLLWPLTSQRFALSLVAVVDPLITLGLAVLLLVAWRSRRRAVCAVALGWLAFWLAYGALQQARVYRTAVQIQRARGHQGVPSVIKPTLGNQRLWRVTYRAGGRVFADAVRVGPFSAPRFLPGESASLVVVEKDLSHLVGTRAYQDLQRFSRLSEGYLTVHPREPNVIGDARYAMLPTSLSPLWGVRYDPTHPEQGVSFDTFRNSGPAFRATFWSMLSPWT